MGVVQSVTNWILGRDEPRAVHEHEHELERSHRAMLLGESLMPTWHEGEEGGRLVLNMGPQHPSTHGVLRLLVELDGERVIRVEPDIGYLHTGIEKTFEAKKYEQGTTLTPRIDYLSPMINTWCYVMAVEKLLEITPPRRAEYLRVIMGELTRINSHLVWLGTHALDIGASSLFLYTFREREMILDVYEMISGARMMASWFRPGGVAYDVPPGFAEAVEQILDLFPERFDDYERLLTENPVWIERTQAVGMIDTATALSLSVTGPILRSTGLAWDLRKTMPYSVYPELDFEIPVGSNGDVYDRYVVRMAEMRESLKIVGQALRKLPDGPFRVDNHKIAPPPKEEIYLSMEALIHHFKLWTEGFRVPPGEAYAALESPRGEMGFYIVSDGSSTPCRVHMRAPSFANLQAVGPMAEGGLVADLIAIIASADPVLGEVDR
ncbi:MAG: NADH dehydrogenase (quinone) subunit D [Ardenticatenaceae bacterium]|nr:NADH dehydrogenase (quinone) subunit D [Ardenticatenaceae bacterium]